MFGKSVEFEFSVGGMSCGHCKSSVERALTALEGVKRAEADLDGAKVKVKAAAGVSLELLKAAVRGAGYVVD